MTKPHLLTALTAMTALLAGGCDSGSSADDVNEMFGKLMRRPHIEAVQADYLALLDRIRARLVDQLGIKPFVPDREPFSGAACPGEMSEVKEAQVRFYPSARSPGTIPDADWPRAVEIVTEITSENGFGEPRTVVDRPGDHEVAIYDTYDAELIIGTAENTIVGLSTGCHLTREAHQRGTPEPEEPLY
ncbi:putative LppA-like lipoprotein [Prauserella shujinwangii]|uniref:Putative LppA-like lipoprotein n=1 Tax=Prauserella shujinwangii TaxID=1453103 RepID=A0A2T0LNW8_9PSEU|nr:LppA family lipoprotein [Prauserella shujinwangii]PRX44939.1 putative LppA-like lipoprotein [Prauserella shujinwangii]